MTKYGYIDIALEPELALLTSYEAVEHRNTLNMYEPVTNE